MGPHTTVAWDCYVWLSEAFVAVQSHIQGTFGASKPDWTPKKWTKKIELYSIEKFIFLSNS